MTPEKLARLAVLQNKEREVGHGSGPSDAEQAELDALRRELAMAPEVADDKSTLFTDESRRPQLNGIDWNDANHRMACDEVGNFVKMLAARFGVPLAEAALQAGIAALKR